MPTAWRIVKSKHAATAFDGEGARQNGGRWTSIGRRAVYTSSTIALATLEVMVHLDSLVALAAYSLFQVRIPEEIVKAIDRDKLPRSWRHFPSPPELCAIGDAWLQARDSAVLEVPSVVIPDELNFLLNPEHPDFHRIAIGPEKAYDIDSRLRSG